LSFILPTLFTSKLRADNEDFNKEEFLQTQRRITILLFGSKL